MRWNSFFVALLLASAGLATTGAVAESALRLSPPEHFGEIPAQTYDEQGRRVGEARLRIERLPGGGVSLRSDSTIDGGASNTLSAELAPVPGGGRLRPITEESHAELGDGRGLGVLRVDHEAGIVRCTDGEGRTQELALPADDRVALAPMNLLFLPLVRGETERIDFQIPICRGGPRLVDAQAHLVRPLSAVREGRRLVEVRYELDFGPVLSSLAKPFLPRFSLWFDAGADGDWMAHRMPLYSSGPTVLVVRTGISPAMLGVSR